MVVVELVNCCVDREVDVLPGKVVVIVCEPVARMLLCICVNT
jgi:hypothetical protein